MLSDFPILKTSRLILRAIHISDAQLVHRNLSDYQTIIYSNTVEPPSLEKVQKMIEKWQQGFTKQQVIRWGITIKGEDAIIGSCGYKKIIKNHRRAEIGYEIFAEYRRQGIISEALNAIIQFGFKVIELTLIEATVNCNNLASISLLNKLGFIEEGVLREYEFQQDKFTDLKLFSLRQKDLYNV
ncbi:MAG: GNAT family N-acetyltransferase [Mastigocoleus sp.]